MQPIEIVVIIVCVLIVGGVIGRAIYRKVKHLPSSSCEECGGCCSSCNGHCQEAQKLKEVRAEREKAKENFDSKVDTNTNKEETK